jgi:hypothetical protein
MRSCQLLPGFLAIAALLLLPREVTLQAFQLLLRLAILPRIVDRLALRVRIVGFESHINPDLLSRGVMLYDPLCLDPELDIIAVSTMHQPHPLDLFRGEGFNVLLGIADESQTTNPTPIGEADVSAIGLHLPAGLLVFHRAVVMLKLGIALLARLVRFAVSIEARDGEPGPVSTGLPSLRIETSSKGIRFGKGGTIALQVVLGDSAFIHLLAQAFVAHELDDTNGFINRSVLLLGASNFVLEDEHASCPCSGVLVD